MKTTSSSRCAMFPLKLQSTILTLLAAAGLCVTVSCGGGMQQPPPPPSNTQVTIVMSSAANDQLTRFDLEFHGITLTNANGATVTVMPASATAEFIHLNGVIEPLISVAIPQGTYTSATATMDGADFDCATLTPQGGIDTSEYAYGSGGPTPTITMTLPKPIVVAGDSMTLAMTMQVVNSEMFSACYSNGQIEAFSIAPTFSLTVANSTAHPTNPSNGKAVGLIGQVTSIDTVNDSFVLTYPELESRSVNVATGASTAYAGVNSFAGLAVGTFVDLDGDVQVDGSLVATRIEVQDPAATSVTTGPLLFVSEAEPALTIDIELEQGALFQGIFLNGAPYYSFPNATFGISGQVSNLNQLPFTPSFTAANMVAGQMVNLSSATTVTSGGYPYTAASGVTLLPQAVDGTISGSSTAGNFTVYDVSLAPYSLFPTMATQAGQTTLLNDPSVMEVYVDSSTQMLNAATLAPGGAFRFYGLVFNDGGTLRMDCAQVNDGVSVTPAMGPQGNAVRGQVKTVQSAVASGKQILRQVITTTP
jgi:Domain of unknown function (DUF5666)